MFNVRMIMTISGLAPNNAMQQTVRAARPLLSRLRPASPRTAASKGRATRPAADRGRWTATENGNRNDLDFRKRGRVPHG